VVNDQDRDVPQGQLGEVAIRGPQLLLGYWGMPEVTEYCAGRLAAYKTPCLIEFVDDLPRTAAIKCKERQAQPSVITFRVPDRHP